MSRHPLSAGRQQLMTAADIDKTVAEVDTDMTDVAQGGRGDRHCGTRPYLRITGWPPLLIPASSRGRNGCQQ